MENRRFVLSEGESLVEASRSLSIEEQRVLALIVSRISIDDEDGKSYVFSVSDIDELITKGESPVGAETRVAAMTLELMKKGLLIKRNKNPKSQLSIGWLSSVQYRHDQGTVEFSFNPYLKPYFLSLKQHVICRAI